MMKTPAPAAKDDLRYLKGVGPKRALSFERLGIRSIRDLLFFFPRRYEDRSQFTQISELKPGQITSVQGEVLSVKVIPIRRLRILEMVVGDASGMIYAVWFNQLYLAKQFKQGQRIILFGKVEWYKSRLQITSPEYEVLEPDEEAVHAGRITPIYPLTEGLFQRSLRLTMRDVIQTQLEKHISEYLPESFRIEKKLMVLQEAVREMHFPTSLEKQAEARQRIVFDEFLIFEMILVQRMERLKNKYQANKFLDGDVWLKKFQGKLPYQLTRGQSDVIKQLVSDLNSEIPMNRLLQGDVGSGKTTVAAFAMLLAAQNKHQAALLVPTEILAEQHSRTLQKMMEPFGVSVGLLTSTTPLAKRERLVAELKHGKVAIAVGTHALLQEDVLFHSLALLIVDEQHKFGVHQRTRLLSRKPRPHHLVMTATPIPRTLAFTLYGDLSISSIKELPAGRQPIKTFWITRQKQQEVLQHILEKVQSGEQAYFIFPLIEETEKMDLLAAEKEFERLREGIFKSVSVGLVHGRMSKEARDRMMKEFRSGEIKILVATSVIEVGVDHPNATMMIIENAERFGLAQLHQMRGRIGRGTKPSECFLFGEPTTDEGKKRLRILTKTQDGFLIAEEDLRLRGPGDFLGTRQSGEPYFRLANPLQDAALLEDARKIAFSLVKGGLLDAEPWKAFKVFITAVAIDY